MRGSIDDPRLTDGVVTLRLPDERDLPAIDLGIHDAEVVRWFGRSTRTAQEVLDWNRDRQSAGVSWTYAICGSDDACVGHAWVNLSQSVADTAGMGYWLLPQARGRGLATRAVRLLSDWAFADLELTRLRLLTEPENERSQRVAERCGFARQGLRLAYGEIDGRVVDLVEFVRERQGKEPVFEMRDA
jgi:RimJ/RimL family protein N-acetyltransferase